MKILFINSVCGVGSTGRICCELAEKCSADGNECKIAYGRGEVPQEYRKFAVPIGGTLNVLWHGFLTRLFDKHGFASKRATARFLRWADEYDPDVLWLHNIHGYYLNIEMLFAWIKSRPQMQVKWTLHDCWAFTGHCAYFSFVECEQWKTKCSHCPQKHKYPASIMSAACKNFERKRAAFSGVKNMTIITPSQWLADLAKQSFLQEYPVEVSRNTINTSVFKPTPSDFRNRYGLENKIMILGVASVWDERKGLNDFLRLAEAADDHFAIVLVGLNNKQAKTLPTNIIGIPRTNSEQELAEIYSAADVLFNPTYEDNYPTVNLEAEACGTRVISYCAGGAPETLHRSDSVCVKPGEYKRVLDQYMVKQ